MSEILPNQLPEIPEHLQEGWKAYIDWKQAMERAGEPLPPGGVFILNRNTILKGCLIRFHRSLQSELKMPFDCIKIDIRRNDLGGLEPYVDVNPPKNWLKTVYCRGQSLPNQRVEEFAKNYIEGVIERYYQEFKRDIEERMEALETRRPELEPTEIEDLLNETSPEEDGVTGEN